MFEDFRFVPLSFAIYLNTATQYDQASLLPRHPRGYASAFEDHETRVSIRPPLAAARWPRGRALSPVARGPPRLSFN